MTEIEWAGRTLGDALRADPSFAYSPERLARALKDLMPFDVRTVSLLSSAARTGIFELLSGGHVDEARSRLSDQAGMRQEVADWTVAAWLRAVTRKAVDPIDWTVSQPVTELPSAGFPDAPGESTGTPTAMRVAVGPAGAALVVVATRAGVFAALADAGSGDVGPARWRRVASPEAPASRDVAVAGSGGRALVAWSDRDGVHLRTASRGAGAVPGPMHLGDSRHVIATAGEEQARYPLALLGADPGALDVLWTADRRQLRRSLVREWLPSAAPAEVPAACEPGERLRSLDIALEAERQAWLVALTDRGRLLLSRWDLATDGIEPWRALSPPAAVSTAAVAVFRAYPTVLVSTLDGHLLSLDARRAWSGHEVWRSVDPPPGAPRESAAPQAVAVGGAGGEGWLAVAAGDHGWVAPLVEYQEFPIFGRARPLSFDG
jgi:hypothetical protein